MRRPVQMALALILAVAGSFSAPLTAQELRRSGYMGLAVAAVPEEIRQQTGIASGGVLVQRLSEGGTAGAAGIQPGDVLTSVNGRPIGGTADFVRTAAGLRAGDTATVELHRGAQVITSTLTVRPRPMESSPDVNTLYGAVEVDGSLRRVIVTAPKDGGRHPAVLYLTGIGCFSQESLDGSSSETKLLYGLTRAGFVTMRVEKSGIGDSQGPACNSAVADLQAETRAYRAGVRRLKQYDFVDARNVFLLGLSIGGVQAPLVAATEPVKGLVVINTVGKNFLEYLLDTRRRQMLLRGTPYDQIESRMKLVEQCNDALLIDKQPPGQIVKQNPACTAEIQYPAPDTYMQQWAGLNLAGEWKKSAAPVLVVNGLSDFVATVADGPYLADMLNSFTPGRAALVTIPGMDHYLLRAASMEESMTRPASDPGEFHAQVLAVVSTWLSKMLG